MGAMIQRLQFEVDRFELYTGLRPIRLVVAPDVLKAYLDELVYGLIAPMDGGARYAEFNGYRVESDPKLPVGAVLVDSERGLVYPLSPVALPPPTPTIAGDSEASPQPWRVSEHDPSSVVDANGKLVCNAWKPQVARSAGDVALIVAAVNAFGPRGRSLPHADDCLLPIGHGGLCIPGEPPSPSEQILSPLPCKTSTRLAHRIPGGALVMEHPPRSGFTRLCALPAAHPGPCVPATSEPCPELACGGRQGHEGPHQLDRCLRDPVCDQGAGHEGPCRYEFPVKSPATLSSDCRLPLAHASGCECARLGQP